MGGFCDKINQNRRQQSTNRENTKIKTRDHKLLGHARLGLFSPKHGTVCFCNDGVRALDQACFLGPPSQQRSGTMTRTRSPSGGRLPGEGTIAQPIDHLMLPVLVCYFFSSWPAPPPPNGQRICTDGTSLVISSNSKSQSYLPPISSSFVVDHLHSWAIVGSSGSLAVWQSRSLEAGTSTEDLPSPLSFPNSVPTQAPDVSSAAREQQLVYLALVPLPAPRFFLQFGLRLHNMPARTGPDRQAGKPRQQGKSTQTTLEVRMMITDRAFLLFQEVDSRSLLVVAASKREPTLNTPPPTHTRAKGALGCMLGLVFRWAPASSSQHVAWNGMQGMDAPGGKCPGTSQPHYLLLSSASKQNVSTAH